MVCAPFTATSRFGRTSNVHPALGEPAPDRGCESDVTVSTTARLDRRSLPVFS